MISGVAGSTSLLTVLFDFLIVRVIQWIASERKAESRVPVAFWYMSLVGGLITLAYAIYRRDPVFIAGQSIGALVYIRNLMLIYRQGPRPAAESVQPAAHRQ